MISKLYDESTIKIIQNFLNSNNYYPINGWVTPNSLFCYTALFEYDDAGTTRDIVDDLNDNIFTVSSPALFNDIYDSTVHMNSLNSLEKVMINAEKILDFPFYSGPYKKIISEIANDNDNNRMTDLLRPLRIKCFSAHINSILQWGLYADKNFGICIEYNPYEWINSCDKFFPVVYTSKPIDVSNYFDRRGCDYNPAIGVILSSINKSLDWKHESEWRLIQNSYDSYDYQPQRVSLSHGVKPKSVTLGKEFCRIPIEEEKGYIAERLVKWLYENDIDTYQLEYKRGTFELIRSSISWSNSENGFWLEL